MVTVAKFYHMILITQQNINKKVVHIAHSQIKSTNIQYNQQRNHLMLNRLQSNQITSSIMKMINKMLVLMQKMKNFIRKIDISLCSCYVPFYLLADTIRYNTRSIKYEYTSTSYRNNTIHSRP